MKWKLLAREYIFRKPPWLTIRHDQLDLPNGNILPEYYVMEYPDWVTVIPTTEDGRFVMVTQYRHGVEQVLTEIPAGVLEEKDATPLDGAKRELLEETGYGGGEWLEFTQLSSNAANTNNITHCFLARGVKRIGSQHFDPGEDIRCGLYTEEEVRGMLMRDEFVDALIAAPLWKYFCLKAVNKL